MPACGFGYRFPLFVARLRRVEPTCLCPLSEFRLNWVTVGECGFRPIAVRKVTKPAREGIGKSGEATENRIELSLKLRTFRRLSGVTPLETLTMKPACRLNGV